MAALLSCFLRRESLRGCHRDTFSPRLASTLSMPFQSCTCYQLYTLWSVYSKFQCASQGMWYLSPLLPASPHVAYSSTA